MATNKHALIRYNVLNKCFSNKWKRYFIEDLIEVCSAELTDYNGVATTVSRRQILEDITFMRSESGYRAPIVSMKEGRRVYYRYDPIDFSIGSQPLNDSELEQLQLALATLNRVKGMPQLEWVNTVTTKLRSGLNLNPLQSSVAISFEENEFLKGLEYLEDLYQYIIRKQPLLIQYQGYKQENAIVYSIHPYYLKQYNNRWFLFGLNAELQSIQNLALDRMVDIKEAAFSYIDSTIDFEEYFEDIVGVTNDEQESVRQVKIRLAQNIIPYIRSKPIHGSQKIADDVLKLEVKLNYELESLILSYGENMEVLEPIELKERITARVSKLFKFY